jgi:pentapeptide MXKDX repeat protein
MFFGPKKCDCRRSEEKKIFDKWVDCRRRARLIELSLQMRPRSPPPPGAAFFVRFPNDRMLNDKMLNDKMLNDKMLNDRMSNDKMSNVKLLNNKIPNDKMSNG